MTVCWVWVIAGFLKFEMNDNSKIDKIGQVLFPDALTDDSCG